MRCTTRSGVVLFVLFALACAKPIPDLKPGERPPLGSVEAGLWMQMDKVEARLKTSGGIVDDERLNRYVSALVCRLSPEFCNDVRVYLVDTPYFNASMRPNGTMEVWTGLILRAENESQLAFVLAHELAHFEKRHSLKQWQDFKFKSGGVLFIQILSAAAGVGYVGDLASLIAQASLFSFSRAQEVEADARGLELLERAGYDAREAAKLWGSIIAETEYAGDGESGVAVFLSTHPRQEDREATLAELAALEEGEEPGAVGRERFIELTLPMRAQFLRGELRTRRFKRTEWLLGRLLEQGRRPAEIEFFKGELYRLRAEEGDEARAIESYTAASALDDCPTDAYRELGLLYRRTGRASEAKRELERYLELDAEATDRKMIESYIEKLEAEL